MGFKIKGKNYLTVRNAKNIVESVVHVSLMPGLCSGWLSK